MGELVVKIGYGRPLSADWLCAKQVEDALDSHFGGTKFEVTEVVPQVGEATEKLVVQLKHILDELGVPSSTMTPEGLAALVSAIKN